MREKARSRARGVSSAVCVCDCYETNSSVWINKIRYLFINKFKLKWNCYGVQWFIESTRSLSRCVGSETLQWQKRQRIPNTFDSCSFFLLFKYLCCCRFILRRILCCCCCFFANLLFVQAYTRNQTGEERTTEKKIVQHKRVFHSMHVHFRNSTIVFTTSVCAQQ